MSEERMPETREKRPTVLKGMGFIVLMALVAAGLLMAALSRRSPTGPVVAAAAPSALSVRTETVSLSDGLVLNETFSGLVSARRTSQLGFSGGGRIANISVDVGDRVRAGQTLARLDTRSLQANLGAAEANIAEAVAMHSLANTTVVRQRTLYERERVAKQRVDEAEAEAAAAAARIAAARAQADMLRVEIDLSTIRAPFAGTVTARMSDEGAIAVPGLQLLELVEDGELEARIGLPSAAAGELSIGEVYQLSSPRGPVAAKLRAATGVIDQSSRTMMTVFDIVSASEVDAGAVVRLALPRDVDERGFWAPVSALTEASRGLWSIYIVEPDGSGHVAVPRLVEIVHTEGTRVFVRGTVRDGERFVVEGLARFVPGQRVQPVSGPSAGHGRRGG